MRLDFRMLQETGVLGKSSGHLFTPLPTAKSLYFYITQIGHYYCTHAYAIRRDYFSPMLVLCVKKGWQATRAAFRWSIAPDEGIHQKNRQKARKTAAVFRLFA